jgi:hypothetical protein
MVKEIVKNYIKVNYLYFTAFKNKRNYVKVFVHINLILLKMLKDKK